MLIIATGQGGHDRDIFSIFLNMKICCVISLKSPHRSDSNDYTQYTIFNIRKKIPLNYSKPAAIGFLQGTHIKNEFETAVVNEPPVFEPLKSTVLSLTCSRALNKPKYLRRRRILFSLLL